MFGVSKGRRESGTHESGLIYKGKGKLEEWEKSLEGQDWKGECAWNKHIE